MEQHPGLTGIVAYAKLRIEGLKYVQKLNSIAFGLYSIGDELSISDQRLYKASFEKVKREIVDEMEEKFNDERDFFKIALDRIYQLIEKSLVLIDSKLPEKTVKEGIVEKMFSFAKKKW